MQITACDSCLELYYCNMVEWFWWDLSLIFDDQLVSFSALTLLVWSSVPEMTCNVLSGTLNLYTATTVIDNDDICYVLSLLSVTDAML